LAINVYKPNMQEESFSATCSSSQFCGSLSQKIKRGEMTKMFVAFNSVPEGSIFLNPYLI